MGFEDKEQKRARDREYYRKNYSPSGEKYEQRLASTNNGASVTKVQTEKSALEKTRRGERGFSGIILFQEEEVMFMRRPRPTRDSQ